MERERMALDWLRVDRQLEREDVIDCLAAEIVRIKMSAVRYLLVSAHARDVSPLLTRPLYAVAAQLGLSEQVAAQVDAALDRARHVLRSV